MISLVILYSVSYYCTFMHKDNVHVTCWICFYQCSWSGSSEYIVNYPLDQDPDLYFCILYPRSWSRFVRNVRILTILSKIQRILYKSSIFNIFMILDLLEKYVVIGHENVQVGSESESIINWPATSRFIIQADPRIWIRNIYGSGTLILVHFKLFWEQVKKSNS